MIYKRTGNIRAMQILMSLPLHHRDTFDHLLMAQAQAEHATLLSEDGQMDQYHIK